MVVVPDGLKSPVSLYLLVCVNQPKKKKKKKEDDDFPMEKKDQIQYRKLSKWLFRPISLEFTMNPVESRCFSF